jgi:diguanylate cyclase (GGDEF)-like protein
MEIVRLPKVNDARARESEDRALVGMYAFLPELGVAFSMPAPSLQPNIEANTSSRSTTHVGASLVRRHGVYRLGIALLLATIGIAAQVAGVLRALPAANVVAVLAYILAIAITLGANARRSEARGWTVALTVAADLLLVFSVTFQVVPPSYYDRVLLLAALIVVLTEFFFGRALAWGALVATGVAYLFVVARAIAAGAPLAWSQELWSLSIFALAGSFFILQYGSFRHRLAMIVELFERAEEGDFSGMYDTGRDARNDSVTMVGRAYNQMRAQLATMVLTDPLSGCLNRRGLEQQMEREISRAVRSGRELALIVLDIDFFKRINDTFGHLSGDGVVREVGMLLRDAVRGADVVARLGGDEFAVLLPETNAAGAYRLAARVRESISHYSFEGVNGRVPITVSIGIVSDHVADEDMAHDLLSRADEALYAAKDGGRNRVSLWTPNLRAIAVERAGSRVK